MPRKPAAEQPITETAEDNLDAAMARLVNDQVDVRDPDLATAPAGAERAEPGDEQREPARAQAAPEARTPEPDGDQDQDTARQIEAAREAGRRDASAAQQRADQLQREKAERDAGDAARREKYSGLIGPDDEYQRRVDVLVRRDPNEQLSLDQEEELSRWSANRAVLDGAKDDFEQVALDRVLQGQAREAARVAGLPGVDTEVIRSNPSFGAVCEHFYRAGEAAVRVELDQAQARLEELETDLKAHRTREVGYSRAPERGGTSGGSSLRHPVGPGASPQDLIAAGLEEQELSGARRR